MNIIGYYLQIQPIMYNRSISMPIRFVQLPTKIHIACDNLLRFHLLYWMHFVSRMIRMMYYLGPIVPFFGKFYLWNKSDKPRTWLSNLVATYPIGKIYQKVEQPALILIVHQILNKINDASSIHCELFRYWENLEAWICLYLVLISFQS